MSEAHLDHPGEMRWYSGYGSVPILGPCTHSSCPHNMLGTVADGPDFDHYTLVRCDVRDEGGCNKECRAWSVEYPPPFGPGRPKWFVKEFRHAPEGATRKVRA